jgi:hypothetical protein
MTAKPQTLSSTLKLRCFACGQEDDRARGWRMYVVDRLRPTTATYCPGCAERELGEDER